MGFDVRHAPGQYPPVTRETPPPRVAIVAAQNEAGPVGPALDALAEALPGSRLIVADDASTDGTQEKAVRHGAQVVSRRRPRGKGGNVTAAAQVALDELGDEATVLLCDADLGSSAGELGPLVAAVEGGACDLAVARFAHTEGGGFGFAIGYARRAVARRCGVRLEAPLSGQRAMRVSTLRSLMPLADGWGLEVGMTIDALRAGYRLEEYELPLSHRPTGRTPVGFLHRARQFRDIHRASRARR
jgi:glycosyltransferase involved in cell wall biosynthesis